MTRQRRRHALVRQKQGSGRPTHSSKDETSSRASLPDFLPAMFRVFWILLAIVSASTAWLYFLVRNAPDVGDGVCDGGDVVCDGGDVLRFPASLAELQRLAALLKAYHATNPGYVTLLFCSAYLYKQAFVIPGSALLNVLGGALFGVWRGFPLCCLLTGAGASLCFALSKYVGKEAVQALFPAKVAFMQAEVQRNRDSLVYFLLFVRVFPISPNWLITLMSPVVGVPYPVFLFTIVVGLMPYNLVCVQSGEMLATMTSLNSLFTASTLFKMTLLAFAMLGPGLALRCRRGPDADADAAPAGG